MIFGELEDRHDVRVLKLRRGLRLAIETGPHLLGVFGEVHQHQLDGDFAIEHRVDAPIEHSHAPLAHPLEDLVAPDLVRITGDGHFVLSLRSFQLLEPRARRLSVGIVGREPLNGLLVFLHRLGGAARGLQLLRLGEGPGASRA